MIDDRLTELEARFMLQQDLLDKLSGEIYRQQRELDKLAARLATLEKPKPSADADDAPADDKPPHY